MIAKDAFERFKTVGSGHISDAMELLGFRRAVLHGFRLLGDEDAVIAGPAFTVTQVPKRHPAAPQDNLVRHAEAAKVAEPGSVIIVDVAGRVDLGSWGENQSLRAKARGMAGVIINGCTRDGRGVARIGLPLFCLGVSPIKSRWDLETTALNQPVTVAGVQVHPGDIVFGDADGIIIVPKDHALEILDRAVTIKDAEEVNQKP